MIDYTQETIRETEQFLTEEAIKRDTLVQRVNQTLETTISIPIIDVILGRPPVFGALHAPLEIRGPINVLKSSMEALVRKFRDKMNEVNDAAGPAGRPVIVIPMLERIIPYLP